MNWLQRLGFATQMVVSMLVIVGFFGAIVVLMVRQVDIQPAIRDVLLVLIGVLAGSFKEVVGYWLGSSHGSTLKTAAQITKPVVGG